MATQPNSGSNDAVTQMADAGVKESAAKSDRPKPKQPGASKEASINFIRPANIAVKAKTDRPRGGRGTPTPSERDDANTLSRGIDAESMPERIRRRYVQDGREFYLPSGERAFVDHGVRLTTRSENTTIVQDLVAVASARGWNEIVVEGTKAFRKEAWRQAKLAGLEVIGYKPSRVEQALLIQRLTRRLDNAHPLERSANTTPSPDDSAVNRRPPAAREGSPLITGRLIDHKSDHYLHDPNQEMSYYVRLKTPRGERTVWGVDLERAVRQSLTDVQAGDDIGLRSVNRRDFRKQTHTIDDDGRRIPVEVEAHRNSWIVEQRRFFEDRKKLAAVFRDTDIKPGQATRKHPELKGSYLQLKAAQLRVEQATPNPEDRAAFVAQVRERMAAAMERGEPLTPVRMRDRATFKEPEPAAKTQTVPDPEHLFAR